jgi:DNA-binding transcriptional LysR family regulator
MQRGHLDDLLAFLAVAREQSFTRAAAKLGVSQSALSHTMRELEARLGVRLLARTTRRVAPTEAGERLVQSLGPRFEEIEAELGALRELRDKPAGTIRITATEYAADAVLLPKLSKLLRDYPDIKVEITMDYGLTDRRWRLDEFILAPPVSSAFTAKLGIPASDLVESERRK